VIRTRIIPTLLIKDEYAVKTINFKNPKYVGDIINIVRIFSDKKADELNIFDIGASKTNTGINFNLIKNIAINARMPLCYGGGISSIHDAEKIFSLGVEKISISKNFFLNENILASVVKKFGSQSIAITLNINKIESKYFYYDSEFKEKFEIIELIKKIEILGAGEIIFNCIHKDGTESGYDEELINLIYPIVKIPITIVGGAKSLENINKISKDFPLLGLGVGSLFIYKGINKAVLISYVKR
jgi:cyclase